MQKITLTLSLTLLGLSLGACTGQNLAKNGSNSAQSVTNDVNLERDFQEVIHYDCNNNITKDGIETVKSPTQMVTITPNDSSKVTGSSFLNSTTNSPAGLISNYTTFTVDYSYGYFNMHVVSGLNSISYTFYGSDNAVVESGTVTLNVTYV